MKTELLSNTKTSVKSIHVNKAHFQWNNFHIILTHTDAFAVPFSLTRTTSDLTSAHERSSLLPNPLQPRPPFLLHVKGWKFPSLSVLHRQLRVKYGWQLTGKPTVLRLHSGTGEHLWRQEYLVYVPGVKRQTMMSKLLGQVSFWCWGLDRRWIRLLKWRDFLFLGRKSILYFIIIPSRNTGERVHHLRA